MIYRRARYGIDIKNKFNNNDFKPTEFEGFKNRAGENAFTLSPKKWIKETNAIGLISKSGRYGGTYAQSDIAFEFASWISPEFKLYIIKDYQRLKKDEAARKAIGWDEKRAISKLNYLIHTDAVKKYLITDELTAEEKSYKFADEADLLNVALFGKRAKDWRKTHPEESKRGENIRDYASAEELIILINLENFNAEWIAQGLSQQERLQKLRSVACSQMEILQQNATKAKLKKVNPKLLKAVILMMIKELRKITGLSQAAFAKKFHIPVGTLSHWEQGVRTPPDYVVYMLSKIIYMEREQYRE